MKSETQRRLEMTNTKIIHKIKTSKKLKVFKKVSTQKKHLKIGTRIGLKKEKQRMMKILSRP